MIMTDDETLEEMRVMTETNATIAAAGASFSNFYVSYPLCCPSRSTILTGLDSSHDGVWNNAPPYGGFETFTGKGDDQATVGTWLQADGYRTALVGKYLNGYYPGTVSYVPPGWDQWDALALQNTPDGDQQGGYYNYAMSVNGTYTFHGSDPSDYSTDVLSGMATDFISSTPSGQPLFLYFAPRAPHEPATPAPRDKTTCTSVPPNRPPNYNEADVSDKPPYVQKLPVWDPATIARWDAFHVKQCRSLQAVDDAVGSIENRTCTVPSTKRRSAVHPASRKTFSMRVLFGSVSAEKVWMPWALATTARCSSMSVPRPRPCWSSRTVNATSASSGPTRS